MERGLSHHQWKNALAKSFSSLDKRHLYFSVPGVVVGPGTGRILVPFRFPTMLCAVTRVAVVTGVL